MCQRWSTVYTWEQVGISDFCLITWPHWATNVNELFQIPTIEVPINSNRKNTRRTDRFNSPHTNTRAQSNARVQIRHRLRREKIHESWLWQSAQWNNHWQRRHNLQYQLPEEYRSDTRVEHSRTPCWGKPCKVHLLWYPVLRLPCGWSSWSEYFKVKNRVVINLCDITFVLRHFHSTTAFIDRAVSSGGLVVVNCVMGWSRSATCVAAYLMMKQNMKATKVSFVTNRKTYIPFNFRPLS